MLTYRSDFPDRFVVHNNDLDFIRNIFRLPNEEHWHRGIGLLTPAIGPNGWAVGAIAPRAGVGYSMPTFLPADSAGEAFSRTHWIVTPQTRLTRTHLDSLGRAPYFRQASFIRQ